MDKQVPCRAQIRLRGNMMQSDKPQVIKIDKHARRKEWGSLDLEERDAKSMERERVFCKSSATGSKSHFEGTRQVREL